MDCVEFIVTLVIIPDFRAGCNPRRRFLFVCEAPDSENGLSIFYDKESLYSSYNRASKNIKEDSLNKLINKFDQEEPNANFSFGFKEDVNVNDQIKICFIDGEKEAKII